MYTSLKHFHNAWAYESASTQKQLDALTDASLSQPITSDARTLGRIAWHIAQTIPEMMARTGLTVAGPQEHDPVPASAAAIADGYRTAAASLTEQLSAHWTDDTLSLSDDMYGDMWTRGLTLEILIRHQAHHRGQLSVLMRQAGLLVHGIYGPTLEDWSAMGVAAPAI